MWLSFFIGGLAGFFVSGILRIVLMNVQYKKGFMKGYGVGLSEFNVANYKIMSRPNYMKSEIITTVVHIPDDEDINKDILNQYRAEELTMLHNSGATI